MPGAFTHDPSATAAFAALPEAAPEERPRRKLKAVVIGGGTGAPVSIRTLLSMGVDTSAVVAMADDGGSTGILREAAGATAPGDIRKCLTAMAGDADDPLTQAFKVRFGFAGNHTLGNLMLSTLEATAGGFPQAIAICEKLLDVRGHVYPSTLDRVTLVARTRDGRTLEGQAVANHSRTALASVGLRAEGGIVAFRPALDAIRAADLVVLGPGSLFTSIIANLIVPGVVDAIRRSGAVVVFVCSLADMQGETRGMTVLEHYDALVRHGMGGLVDFMLVHEKASGSATAQAGAGAQARAAAPAAAGAGASPAGPAAAQGGPAQAGGGAAAGRAQAGGGAAAGRATDDDATDDDAPAVRDLARGAGDLDAIRAAGTRVVTADLAAADQPTWHDPVKLRHAFSDVFAACRVERRS